MDTLTLSKRELRLMLEKQRLSMLEELEAIVTRALTKASIESGKSSPMVSQAEAFRVYGRRKVERWVSLGKLRPFAGGKGNRKYYAIEQLQRLASKSIFSA